ncbi:MAG: peptidyl-prolyl cis-trans isomerase [Deltaproteobacteria bacterium]|jgi:parvulin-like peptidyl-prolyl isomerase|nr:peptidyl-prolyl cis-trans isomerase [Deltaproteobacteria bacterium]
MSERERKLFDARSLFFSSAVLILFTVLATLILYSKGGNFAHIVSMKEENTIHRELANKLKSVGIADEAIKQYENYFNTTQVDKRTRSNLAYTLGKLYLEESNYERALSWFYRVDMIDPKTPLKSEVGSKIVHCLEMLGKFHAAEYALEARSSLEENQQGELKGGTLVAEIGSRKITLREVDEALDALPPWMKEQFKGSEKKLEFMKKYVSDELFYRKAKKLEYDKDGELRKKTADFMKQLMISKVLEEELKDKITVEEDDLKNYFKANQEHYKEKAQARIRLIKAGMEEIAQNILKELKQGKDFAELAKELSLEEESAKRGGEWEGWISKGKDDLGIGNIDEVSKAIFSASPGSISPIVKAGNYYYIFKVEELKPERMREYAEVKEWVNNDYMNHKMKIAYQNLLKQVLESSEVKLYPEVITEEDTSS